MYRTSAPVAGSRLAGGLAPVPLRLTRILYRRFGQGGHRLDNPEVYRYFADLTAGYEVAHRRELVERAAGNSFMEMADALLGNELAGWDRIDLAVVAHSTPDLDPRLSLPVNLAAVLPGGPLAFAVTGRIAAFTALRVVSSYVNRHGYGRALVLVLDQGTMPYQIGEPVGDAAAALVLEAAEPNLAVGVLPDVAPADVPARLAEMVGAEPGTLVTGPGLEPLAGAESGSVSEDFPCTGLWSALHARGLPGRAVLADYDPVRRDLAIGTLC
jgi:hypothetical protein